MKETKVRPTRGRSTSWCERSFRSRSHWNTCKRRSVRPSASSPTGSAASRTCRCRDGSSTGARRSSSCCPSSRSGCCGASRCSRATRPDVISAARSRGSCWDRCATRHSCSRSCSSPSSGAAALVGDTDPIRNLAPTWVYVIFWLGLPALSVVFGNVWRALSPWRALADAGVWVWERSSGRAAQPLAAYPERLGRWPGAVALLAFTALELAYSDPASPRALAFAIAIYTYVTLFGMAAFGRDVWSGRGEGFAILLRPTSPALPPCTSPADACRLRWPVTGLAGRRRVPGSLAFIAVMLGSVAFDGYSRTATWQDLLDAGRRALRRLQPESGGAGGHRAVAVGARLRDRRRCPRLRGHMRGGGMACQRAATATARVPPLTRLHRLCLRSWRTTSRSS